jgi:hypothetical protein
MPYAPKNKVQVPLFEELEHPINDEWQDMPEFVQDAQEAFATLIVRFRNKEDLEEFGKLIGQKFTPLSKSTWHPPLPRGLNANKRYVDES